MNSNSEQDKKSDIDTKTIKKVLDILDYRIGELAGDIIAYNEEIKKMNAFDIVPFRKVTDSYNCAITAKDELEKLYDKIMDLK